MNATDIAREFHDNGFAIVRSLFSPAEVDEMLRQLDDYIARVVPTLAAGDVYYEDSPARPIKSLFRMDQRSPFFDSLRADERLLALMRAIWPDGDVVRETVMFFGKPAGDGSVTPSHQDNTFQCWSPPLALTATIALDESTPENGVLICQKGSHKIGLMPHKQSGVMGFSRMLIDPVDTSTHPEVELRMRPGDVALHQIQTIHRSGANRSSRPRRQLGIGYRSSLAQRDPVAWAQYHRDLEALHAQKAATASASR